VRASTSVRFELEPTYARGDEIGALRLVEVSLVASEMVLEELLRNWLHVAVGTEVFAIDDDMR
jgi:hypothetical protein